MKKIARLYLRIDPELKQQVQDYCYRNHTTVSDLVNRFLARVLEEDKKKDQEAPQI